jgi:hypothetical protein
MLLPLAFSAPIQKLEGAQDREQNKKRKAYLQQYYAANKERIRKKIRRERLPA